MTTRFDTFHARVRRLNDVHELRLDAGETAAFARQLEDIDAQLYRVEYPELKGTLLVPAKTDIDPGAEKYTYRSYRQLGSAKRISNYAEDFPRVDLVGAEESTNIGSYGDSYGWSIQDMRRAAMMKLPLENERALVARETLARKVDEVIAVGDATLNVTGFTNSADVSLVTPATGTWSSATADQIADDLFKLERAIITTSKGVERADTLVLPPSLFALADTKRLSNTEVSALDFFRKKTQGIRNIETWYHLETAGASSVARIVAYARNPAKLSAILPVEFEQFPPQAKGMAFGINCHARCGGTVIRYPGSMRYMDGC